MIFSLKGVPTPLRRPRFTTLGVSHDFQSHKDLKILHGLWLKFKYGKKRKLTGPLHLSVTFFMPIPKYIKIKEKERLVGTYHVIKPSVSNLVKYLEAVTTGIIYKNDAIITMISAQKLYSLKPRTEFTVKEIKNDGKEGKKKKGKKKKKDQI